MPEVALAAYGETWESARWTVNTAPTGNSIHTFFPGSVFSSAYHRAWGNTFPVAPASRPIRITSVDTYTLEPFVYLQGKTLVSTPNTSNPWVGWHFVGLENGTTRIGIRWDSTISPGTIQYINGDETTPVYEEHWVGTAPGDPPIASDPYWRIRFLGASGVEFCTKTESGDPWVVAAFSAVPAPAVAYGITVDSGVEGGQLWSNFLRMDPGLAGGLAVPLSATTMSTAQWALARYDLVGDFDHQAARFGAVG